MRWRNLILLLAAVFMLSGVCAYQASAQDDAIICPITELPDRLHQKVFNASVNVGVNRGAKLLQQSINVLHDPDIRVDGKVGPATRGALCGLSEDKVIETYKVQQANFYRGIVNRRPSQAKFLKGWLNRAAWEPQ